MKAQYTITSGDITVSFTADLINKNDRTALANELTELRDTESLKTIEFLEQHSMDQWVYKQIASHYPTVPELAAATDKDLLSIRNIGKRRIYFLREALRKEGYVKA